jgi:hypothetical protein
LSMRHHQQKLWLQAKLRDYERNLPEFATWRDGKSNILWNSLACISMQSWQWRWFDLLKQWNL